jgi:hypothetical protein
MNADVRDMQFIPGIVNIKTYFTMFSPRPVIVEFEVDKIALMQVFFSTIVFAYHCHHTAVPCSSITDPIKSHQLDSVVN